MAGGLVPKKRFRPDYYAGIRYVLDPATGQVVQEGQPVGSPSTPIASMGAADITTVGLAPASQASSNSGAGGGLYVISGRDKGGDRGFGGRDSFDRGFDDLPSGDIDNFIDGIPGGASTAGSAIGAVTGTGPLAGLVGSGVDVYRDYKKAKGIDPEYDSNIGKWGASILDELTGGLLGKSQYDRATDELTERKGWDRPGPRSRPNNGKAKRDRAMKELRDRGGDRGGGRDRGDRASGEGAAGGNENAPAGRGRDGL